MTVSLRFNGGDSLSQHTIIAAGLTTIGENRNGRFTPTRTVFGDGSTLEHASANEWWSWLTTSPMTYESVTCSPICPRSDGPSTEYVWTLNKHNADGGRVDEQF